DGREGNRLLLRRARRLSPLTGHNSVSAVPMTNLLDLDPAALAAWLAERGQKPFRARQVSRWVHQRFVDDVQAMTDLAAGLRTTLAAEAGIIGPTVLRDTTAGDGTRKWLLDAGS